MRNNRARKKVMNRITYCQLGVDYRNKALLSKRASMRRIISERLTAICRFIPFQYRITSPCISLLVSDLGLDREITREGVDNYR